MLTAYVAQAAALSGGAVLAALFALALSAAQRRLSTPARLIRRKASGVAGPLDAPRRPGGPLDERTLLAPLEAALRALSWAVVLLAASLAVTRLG